MSRWLKLSIGLAAALLVGWLSHGPIGRGAAFIDLLDAEAKAAILVSDGMEAPGEVMHRVGLPGVEVHMRRDPLTRLAILSGPANSFQRCGSANFERDHGCTPGPADLPGLNGRVEAVPGMGGVHWVDEDGGAAVPLIAEMLGLSALAWLIGLGLGWLLFRPRRKRTGYL